MRRKKLIGIGIATVIVVLLVVLFPLFLKYRKASDMGVDVKTLHYYLEELKKVEDSDSLKSKFEDFKNKNLADSHLRNFRNFIQIHFYRGLGIQEPIHLENSLHTIEAYARTLASSNCAELARKRLPADTMTATIAHWDREKMDTFFQIYFEAARSGMETAPIQTSSQATDNAWVRAARKQGFLKLKELRSNLTGIDRLPDTQACSVFMDFLKVLFEADASSRMILALWFFGEERYQ